MHIGILSFRSFKRRFSYESKRIEEEAIRRKHKVTMIRYQRCMMKFDGKGNLGIRYGNQKFPKDLGLIIPRASTITNAPLRSAIVEHMQLMNLPMLNGFNAITRAKNKLQTLQILSYYGIPVVKTAVINNNKYLRHAVKYIGEFPIIMKTIYGTFGNGVAIVESERSVKSTYGILANNMGGKNAILLQEYIAESQGKDIRLFVIGGEVVASMQRCAEDGDFRSNVGQGGSGEGYKPTREEVSLAIKATRALGLEVSGVDIIQTKHGPAIMEVNANPGFQELEQVSGVNVAEKIVRYGEKFARGYVAEDVL